MLARTSSLQGKDVGRLPVQIDTDLAVLVSQIFSMVQMLLRRFVDGKVQMADPHSG